ncbi:NAD-dependent epimerase/dehydratase family protein [Mycolicibacterium arseniciresistens]|uniref:NAD-dependent epimerase/dehydratase family protein n=1 Tax=Mycolicibacterium arseniciresistens TaxID=3062257 RepID=A0ABT8UDF7_9MYCO|nr:NAD-dependent epimerase/dehydratase family protein [Mycolicibacterium arseniciresistens]MDO3634229.1 NAD-dependent epimerase/dehydratase family protein [Mycolicibacterium arseniciresistens]
MRVVVTGASGNVGAGVLRALAAQMPDAEVVGICRRPPTTGEKYERVQWHAVDLSSPTAAAELEPALRRADVVIHLALAIQPVRDTDYLYRANVLGTQALLSAMTAAGIRQLVYASSLGIYAPGRGEPVSEDWPDTGQPASTYSRHKVMVERMLDRFVEEQPETVVARFRPTVVVQREAAWLIRSLYLGPLVPRAAFELLRRGAVRLLPLPRGIALQFVHADDVGDAVIRMMQHRAHGSYNIAANVLDSTALAALVGAQAVGVNPRMMRTVVSALSASRVVALTPGWYDVATNSPVMDTSKARRELGWAPTRTSAESAMELLDGMAEGAAGTSAAMGWRSEERRMTPQTIRRIHDGSLLLWTTLAVARALGFGAAKVPEAAAVAVNLAAGTPMALERVLERRRDPVAILAPLAVVAALTTTVRGGWAPVAATTALSLLAAAERRRASRMGKT